MELVASPCSVGVDLGKRAIRVAAIRPGHQSRLLHAAVHPMPDGAMDGGVLLDPQAVTDALKEALHGIKLRGSHAVVGMAGRNVVIRTLVFPPMPPDELKNAVKWEAERHLPLRIEEAVLDAQVLREVTEDGQQRLEVLMAAVPERDALAYHQVATRAGLDVAVIEASALALMRTLGDTARPMAALDVGAESTEIVIVHETLPLVCRNIPVGAAHLPEAGDPEAQPPAGGDAPAVAPGLRDLLTGVVQSLDYFQAQVRRERVARVVLTGEGAGCRGLRHVLAGELGIPVTLGTPLARFAAAPAVAESVRGKEASLAIAAGLAMRPVS